MTYVSGRLVIVCVLGIALAAAGVSWLFRYSATRQVARFWGRRAIVMRDNPQVYLLRIEPSESEAAKAADGALVTLEPGRNLEVVGTTDLSTAPGITHLRNALLEDGSFDWPALRVNSAAAWRWALLFPGNVPEKTVLILFTDDFAEAALYDGEETRIVKMVSCAPIKAGLRTMFKETTGRSTESR